MATMNTMPTSSQPASGLRSASPAARASSPKPPPASPGRPQQSPRVASPASSLIFERSVQEDGAVAAATSPAIPAHIATENHIPAVLESASKAITDDHLDPDAVEIVTHVAHQPASIAVAGGSNSDMPLTPLHLTHSTASQTPLTQSVTSDAGPQIPPLETTSPIMVPLTNSITSGGLGGRGSPLALGGGSEFGLGHGSEDTSSQLGGSAAPNYGSLDSTDVRRLSFISFADVVHAEQLGGDTGSLRESLLASPTSQPATTNLARSPSPMRSPVSPSLSAASGAGSAAAAQLGEIDSGSPPRVAGSPLMGLGVGSHGPGSLSTTTGELSIETLGQALRNTTSGDLSGVRSSMILTEDAESHR